MYIFQRICVASAVDDITDLLLNFDVKSTSVKRIREYCRHRMKQSKLGYVIKMRSHVNFVVDFEIGDLIKNILICIN